MTLFFDGSPVVIELGAATHRAFHAPTFSADVYNGQPMFPRVSGANTGGAPVIIDIAGVRVSRNGRKTPVLYHHDRLDPIGHTIRVDLLPDRITAEGVLSVPGRSRDRVAGGAQAGFRWAVSLGFEASEMEFLPPSKEATVNRRRIRGPINIARHGRLCEFSLLAIGADPTASAKVDNASG